MSSPPWLTWNEELKKQILVHGFSSKICSPITPLSFSKFYPPMYIVPSFKLILFLLLSVIIDAWMIHSRARCWFHFCMHSWQHKVLDQFFPCPLHPQVGVYLFWWSIDSCSPLRLSLRAVDFFVHWNLNQNILCPKLFGFPPSPGFLSMFFTAILHSLGLFWSFTPISMIPLTCPFSPRYISDRSIARSLGSQRALTYSEAGRIWSFHC